MQPPSDRQLVRAVLWRRLDVAGLERCVLWRERDGWALTGTLVVEKPFVDLRYEVRCDERWRTRAATARMRADADQREVDLAADAEGRWRRDGSEIDALRGCADVDLQLTPATNTLPIRRLDLALGAEAEVNAAWLRFPALDLVPLRQRYARIGPRTYRYESPGFTAELSVDELGLVTRCGELWERVESTGR